MGAVSHPGEITLTEDDEKTQPLRAFQRGAMRLVLIHHGKTEVVPLPLAGTCYIGRGPRCAIRVDDASMSRTHAALHVREDGVELEDLGSRNGTWLGNAQLSAHERIRLEIGKACRVGGTVMLLHHGGGADPLRIGGSPATPSHTAGDDDEAPLIVSAPMEQLRTLAEQVAGGDITVLLLGETGVGKELVARLIHRASRRARKPFVAVNCPAMPEALLESELFGYDKGAFTGALGAKTGLLQAAEGGTVFLDEVGELPLAVQAKLLRVLEDRIVRPVGAQDARPVNVRFIAATNRALEAEVERGTFRRDLFFRLSGIALTVPPLRDRPDDIAPLAQYFLGRSCSLLGLTAQATISQEGLQQLSAHDWPGNVRELRNVIERAALLSNGGTIMPEHLHMEPPVAPVSRGPEQETWRRSTSELPVVLPPPRATAVTLPNVVGLRGAVDDFERDKIIAALDACGGNQTRAAEMLGISRRGLSKKLDKYAIARPRKG
jgi:two-component system, NtrC family, response regulator AtoC